MNLFQQLCQIVLLNFSTLIQIVINVEIKRDFGIHVFVLNEFYCITVNQNGEREVKTYLFSKSLLFPMSFYTSLWLIYNFKACNISPLITDTPLLIINTDKCDNPLLILNILFFQHCLKNKIVQNYRELAKDKRDS